MNFTNGEGHYRWGGDDICYSALHSGCDGGTSSGSASYAGRGDRRLDWALIPGRGRRFRDGGGWLMGSRDIADYVALCRSCHIRHGGGDDPCLGPAMETTLAR